MCETRPHDGDSAAALPHLLALINATESPHRYVLLMVDTEKGTAGMIGGCDTIDQVGGVLSDGAVTFYRTTQGRTPKPGE